MAQGPLLGFIPIWQEDVVCDGAVPANRVVMRSTLESGTNAKRAKLPTSATAVFYGISNNRIDAASGDTIPIIIHGRAWGTAAAAITRGQRLITDVNGKLSPALDAVGEQVIGVAEEDAATDAIFAVTISNYVR